ncbi:MAG TPA: hypothetical protein VHM02_00420 [Thermoanaerobaculia bacterium]|nr:hypothetical protein [Thermoanaerobaculia bacterium]
MSPAKRQRALLAVLLVIGALAAWVRIGPSLFGGGAGGDLAADGGPAGRVAGGVEVVTLDLDALVAEPRDYSPGRNPFDYGAPPPPPPPSPEELARIAAEEEARRLAAEEARRLAAEQARELAENPPPPPAPQPPEFRWTYLGSFGPENRRIAVFTDGEEIHNALVGDVLAGQFVVADIGYESVAIAFVEFPDEPPRRFAIGS